MFQVTSNNKPHASKGMASPDPEMENKHQESEQLNSKTMDQKEQTEKQQDVNSNNKSIPDTDIAQGPVAQSLSHPSPANSPKLTCRPAVAPTCSPQQRTLSPEVDCNHVLVSSTGQICSPNDVCRSPVTFSPDALHSSELVPIPVTVSSPVLVCSPPLGSSPVPVCSPEMVLIPEQINSPEPMPLVCSPGPVSNPVLVCNPEVPICSPQPVIIAGQVQGPEMCSTFPPVCNPLPVSSPLLVSGPQFTASSVPVCSPGVTLIPGSISPEPVHSYGSVNSAENPDLLAGQAWNESTPSGSGSMSGGITISNPYNPSLIGNAITCGIQNPVPFVNPAAPVLSHSTGVIPEPLRSPSPIKSPLTIVELSQEPEENLLLDEIPSSDTSQPNIGMSTSNFVAPEQDKVQVGDSIKMAHAKYEVEKTPTVAVSTEAQNQQVPSSHPCNTVASSPSKLMTSCSLESRPAPHKVYVGISKQLLDPTSAVFVPEKKQHAQSSTIKHTKQYLNPKTSAFVPKKQLPNVGENFDDSFLLLKYLPKLTNLPCDKRLYLHAYR